MKTIDISDVCKIARIALNGENISLQKDIQTIVSWMLEIKSVESSTHNPMFYVNLTNNRTYNNDSSPQAQKTEDVLFNNKIQTTENQESDKQNYFKTILVVE